MNLSLKETKEFPMGSIKGIKSNLSDSKAYALLTSMTLISIILGVGGRNQNITYL